MTITRRAFGQSTGQTCAPLVSSRSAHGGRRAPAHPTRIRPGTDQTRIRPDPSCEGRGTPHLTTARPGSESAPCQHTHTHTHTHTPTSARRRALRYTHTDTHTDTHRHTHRCLLGDGHTHTDTQTHTHTHTHTHPRTDVCSTTREEGSAGDSPSESTPRLFIIIIIIIKLLNYYYYYCTWRSREGTPRRVVVAIVVCIDNYFETVIRA